MSTVDAEFAEHRPGLERLAYRMLGSLADADDVVQEAYLRWKRADRSEVESPRAYLYSVVTRLCIDLRRAVDARKESYIGPWLPEPVVEHDPAGRLEAAESVSIALLVVLESLSPIERAAYLLRRVFDYEYDEVSAILGKAEPNCRQLVSRAEDHIRERRPRFDPAPGEAERLTGEFLQACATGNLNDLVQILAADAVLYSDGGGRVLAARAPIRGADRVARFFLGVLKKATASLEVRHVRVNGRPGVIVLEGGQLADVITLDVADGRVTTCFVIRNPDKLSRVLAKTSPQSRSPL
jgi:RNA polymerase sigma-70 factor (ECF subfamily)